MNERTVVSSSIENGDLPFIELAAYPFESCVNLERQCVMYQCGQKGLKSEYQDGAIRTGHKIMYISILDRLLQFRDI
jgi:hypothetical protein